VLGTQGRFLPRPSVLKPLLAALILASLPVAMVPHGASAASENPHLLLRGEVPQHERVGQAVTIRYWIGLKGVTVSNLIIYFYNFENFRFVSIRATQPLQKLNMRYRPGASIYSLGKVASGRTCVVSLVLVPKHAGSTSIVMQVYPGLHANDWGSWFDGGTAS
jgi:hypothetical protein